MSGKSLLPRIAKQRTIQMRNPVDLQLLTELLEQERHRLERAMHVLPNDVDAARQVRVEALIDRFDPTGEWTEL